MTGGNPELRDATKLADEILRIVPRDSRGAASRRQERSFAGGVGGTEHFSE
jgi:hypothetical protein